MAGSRSAGPEPWLRQVFVMLQAILLVITTSPRFLIKSVALD